MIDLYAHDQIPPILSFFVIVLASGTLVALAIVALLRSRRRAELAEAASARMDPAHTLHEGEVVLHGIVEHAPDQKVAVRVDVTQHGDESESSGSWSHSWREVDRKVVVAPFYLRLADDTRVRVEAPPDVDVADDLDKKVLVSHTSRVLSAELVPGETIHATGWLERGGDAVPTAEAGYRDVTFGWVLRAGRGRMLLSSTPLGSGLEQRARFHRRYGLKAIIFFVGLQLSLSWYYTRLLGTVEPALILDRHHSTYVDSDGDTQDRYEVIVLKGGSHHTIKIDGDDYERATPRREVPVRRGSLDWQLGTRPTITVTHAVVMLVLAFGLVFTYHRRRVASRPWFRRRVDHRGSGRLPGPR